MRTASKLVAAGLAVVSMALLSDAATAAPLTGPRALTTAQPATAQLQTVQFRRGWRGGWRGRRWIGPAAGVAAGVAVGTALASPYYYGPGYDEYAYEPYVVATPGVGPGVVAEERDDAYCAQRFRSYDPGSGTYLGYDGLRHPCP